MLLQVIRIDKSRLPIEVVCDWSLDVQSQVGWGFEQPDLVEDVPVHGRGMELDDL